MQVVRRAVGLILLVAVASPGATTPVTTLTPTPRPAAGDSGPSPLVIGGVAVVAIAGVALLLMRRR